MLTQNKMSGLKNCDDALIQISALASYTYCDRRYYLLNIECNTQSYGNALTEQGKIDHSTVHFSKIEKRKNFVKVHNMQVFSNHFGLIGNCDTVEMYENASGSFVPFLQRQYDIVVVEHKQRELDFNDCDIVQIAAQTMCLEEMFNTQIDCAYIYYMAINKRIRYEITDQERDRVKTLINKIRLLESSSQVPPVRLLKSCNNCAAYDICNPKMTRSERMISKLWGRL